MKCDGRYATEYLPAEARYLIRNALLILFFVMLGARALQLDLSLGPGLSVKNALLYLTAVLIAVESALAGNRKVELMTVIVPFAVLVLYAILTVVVIVLILDFRFYEPVPALIRLKTKLVDQLLMLLVFFYGVVNLKDAMWLLKGMIWAIIVSSVVTVVDTFDIPDLGIITTRDDGRVEGILASAQEFAALLAFFIPLIVAFWWTESGLKRFLALLGIGVSVIALLLAASRGAVVGLLIGSAFAAFYLRRRISPVVFVRAFLAGVIFSAITVSVLIFTDFGEVLQTRFTHGMESGDIGTFSSGRTANWSGIVSEMFKQPLTFITGFGWESFFHSIGYHRATHSVYIDRLYNLGLIGLVLTITLFVNSMSVARRLLNGARAEVTPYLTALVFALASFMVAIAFSDIEAATYTWGCTGVLLRMAMASKELQPGGHSKVATGPGRRQVSRAGT